jgi:hypothetical protein
MSNLGGFSEEALQLFQLAASERAYDFSEEGEVYDFTRCMRPNGTYYGTRGQCKSGSNAGAKAVAEPKVGPGRRDKELDRQVVGGQKAAARAAKKMAAEPKRQKAPRPDEETLNRRVAAQEKAEAELKRATKLRKAVGMAGPEQRALAQRMVDSAARRKASAGKDQLKDAHRQSSEKAKGAARAAKEAEKNFRSAEKELKKDPKNKELRARYKEAIKAANDAERELKRADRENDKAARARGRQYDREQRAMMTPAQRKADRELRQRMKELG